MAAEIFPVDQGTIHFAMHKTAFSPEFVRVRPNVDKRKIACHAVEQWNISPAVGVCSNTLVHHNVSKARAPVARMATLTRRNSYSECADQPVIAFITSPAAAG